jgi:hypothetical protein
MTRKTTRHVILLLSILCLGLATTGCMQEPPNFGTYPTADDPGLHPAVSKEDALETAALALRGLEERDFDLWRTGWSTKMRDVVDRGAFHSLRDALIREYGHVVSLEEVRLTRAEADGYVRYAFLVEHQKGYLMLLHVYPEDGTEIAGVHVRDAETGEVPQSLQ